MPGPDAPAPLTADSLLGGRYRLVRPVASGGMAAVWEGRDEVLARSVAVKILHAHLAADEVFLERFRREAIAVARLSHPNIVATFDAGTAANGTAYIVMELVRGTTLRQRLAGGALPAAMAVGIGIQIADALRHAHAAGLVHRDIKPANILLCKGDTETIPQVKVADFGIAKAAAGMGLDLTRTGMVLGTAKYLSPEQVDGREPDARADLYSLGVVMFEMLTGDPPFDGPTDMAVALARLDGPAPRVGARCWGLPPALDLLVAGLLARDPDKRPSSAADVRQALAAMQPMGPSGPIAPAKGADATAVMQPAPVHAPGADRLSGPAGRVDPVSPTSNAKTAVAGGRASVPGGVTVGPRRRWAPPAHDMTDMYQAGQVATRRPRRSRWPGWLVAALAAVAVVMAAVILFGWGLGRSPGSQSGIEGGGAGAGATLAIRNVTVFHLERDADNTAKVGYTHDGNPSTVWMTDIYYGPNFAHLRKGLGLAIALDGSHAVHHLKVDSPTHGWSAQVYLAAAVPTSASLTPWGQAVAVKQGIEGGVTFDLGGRTAAAILLWITDLGPTDQAGIAELTVS